VLLQRSALALADEAERRVAAVCLFFSFHAEFHMTGAYALPCAMHATCLLRALG